MKHGLSSVVPSVVVVRYRDDYRRAGMVSAPICTANPNRVHASSATAEARGAQSHVMCIDDLPIGRRAFVAGDSERALNRGCLLYTSDAADDLLCVDLGGRRIIKN